MNVLRDIIILSNNFDDNSIKISQNNIKIDYLIHLYGIKNINFNKDIYIKKQIQFTMNNNSLLYNRMVNINNSLVEMTKERYNKFIYFTNSKIFVKYLYVDQMSRLQKLREMLLYIDPFYSKNCILYSGATLLLFGSRLFVLRLSSFTSSTSNFPSSLFSRFFNSVSFISSK
jgi:hypothetical protein